MEENKMENEQKNTEEVADEKTAAAEQTPAERFNTFKSHPASPRIPRGAHLSNSPHFTS